MLCDENKWVRAILLSYVRNHVFRIRFATVSTSPYSSADAIVVSLSVRIYIVDVTTSEGAWAIRNNYIQAYSCTAGEGQKL